MKKAVTNKIDELRPEYDLSKLKRGVRGKYYARARAGTNLVLIEPRPGKCLPGFKRGEPSIAIVGRHSRGGRRSHKAYASGAEQEAKRAGKPAA